MRACAPLLLALALVGCEVPADLDVLQPSVSTVQSGAIVGYYWRVRRPPYGGHWKETWRLFANGDAVYSSGYGDWMNPDESCRWSLEGDVLTTACPHGSARAPVVVTSDRVEVAPLVREADVTEPSVLGRWSAQVETRNDDDALDFFPTEQDTVTLYDDFRVTTESRRGAREAWVELRGEYGCAIEDEGDLTCRYTPEWIAHLETYVPAENLDRMRAHVLRVPFDEDAGEPRFAGAYRMQTHWERM